MSNDKKVGFWKKVGNIDVRLLYVLLILSMAIPLLFPLGLPISTSPTTRSAYELVDSLQPGDRAFVFIEMAASGWPEVLPGLVATVQHLISKDVKLVFAPGAEAVDHPATMTALFGAVDFSQLTYGVDYVYFGYFPGEETGLATLAENFRAVYKTDYYGTNIDEIPMMQEVNDATDFQVALCYATGGGSTWIVKHWGIGKGVPVIDDVNAISAASLITYYGVGLTGMLVSTRGAAEYELLISRPGTAVKRIDALNIVHLLFMAMVIIGNVEYFTSRGEK